MQTTWNHRVGAVQGLWSHVAAAMFGAPSRVGSMVLRQWGRWRAARLRAAELRMLRELSPSVLRDIGVEPEAVVMAQGRERPMSGRDAVMRLL